MLKRSLLSLSVAAIMVSGSGCKISSVEDNDVVDTTAVTAQNPDLDASGDVKAAHPYFDPAHSVVQFGSDFIFADAAKSDGTANTGVSPSSASYTVAGAIDDLDGWSTTAAIDIPFSAELDPTTVHASGVNQNVFLIKLEGGKDNPQVDALDFAQIAALGSGAIGTATVVDYLTNQIGAEKNYTASVVSVNGGTNNLLRILPKKPLASRTKYIVVVTNGILDADGEPVQASANYTNLVDSTEFASPKLASIHTLLAGMESLAAGFFGGVDANSGGTTFADDEIVFTAPITTTDPTYALRVNAAPGIFVEDELDKYAADIADVGNAADVAADMALAEKLLGTTTVNGIVASVASGLSMPATTAEEIAAVKATLTYQATVRGAVAGNLATIKAGFKSLVNAAADKPAAQDFGIIDIAGLSNADTVVVDFLPGASVNSALSKKVAIMQGYIALPQYTEKLATDAKSIWRASDAVGAVFAGALGGTYPPKDLDGTTNVTYRFPFAEVVRTEYAPVLITYPNMFNYSSSYEKACDKPANGWPVAIFMHGITVDRGATLAVADQLAQSCIAMVAIDQPHHGIAPKATDRNGATVANSRLGLTIDSAAIDANSPASTLWAAALAASAAADTDLAAKGIAERHQGLYLSGADTLPMAYGDSAAGKSGDFFIRLDNFPRTRDNVRQAVMDLLNLSATLGDIDVDGSLVGSPLAGLAPDADTDPDFDLDKVYFIGHSLGAIVGTTFTSVISDAQVRSNNSALPEIKASVLANPGGQLSKLLENSVSFSASLIPGLAAKGLTQGTLSLEQFFAAVQAHVDQGDPINYAANLADTNTPVLLFEMVGGGTISGTWGASGCSLSDTLCGALTSFPADLVVPNKGNGDHELVSLGSTRAETATSYLAGTDPLVTQLDLTQYDYTDFASDLNADGKNDVTIDGSTPMKAVIKYKNGTHGTFASADVPATFADMMAQTISFFSSSGVLISRYNNAVDAGVATAP